MQVSVIQLKAMDVYCFNRLDLFLTLDVNNAPKFRIYELPIESFKLYKEYDPPPGIAIYHLSTFADIGKVQK